MNNFWNELKHDLNFIKSHTLQPKWFKTLKVFLLLGFLWGYVALFGWGKTIVFAVSFFGWMLIVHFLYRAKTKRFSESWLDFIVYEESGQKKYKRIGMYYYGAIIFSAALGFVFSQVFSN
jgi:hypothetical protein